MSRLELHKATRSTPGFSMVELLLSIAISVVVLALALGTFSSLDGALRQQRNVSDLQSEQHFALLEIEKDLRNAGADPRGVGLFRGETFPVDIVPTGQPLAGGLRLRTDWTGPQGAPDGDLADVGEVVVYLWDEGSGTVSRWSALGDGQMISSVILTRCSRFGAELLDRAGAPATPGNTAQVRVTMASSTEPAASSSSAVTHLQYMSLAVPNRVLATDASAQTQLVRDNLPP